MRRYIEGKNPSNRIANKFLSGRDFKEDCNTISRHRLFGNDLYFYGRRIAWIDRDLGELHIFSGFPRGNSYTTKHRKEALRKAAIERGVHVVEVSQEYPDMNKNENTRQIWYGVKHKPTGGYMPKMEPGNHSHWSPSSENTRPRLFDNEKNAQTAMTAWAKGVYRPQKHGHIKIEHDASRRRDDLEIVSFTINKI